MKKAKINLIFDCDGTLIDSYDAIADRIARVFEAMGIYADRNEIRSRALYSDTKTAILQTTEQLGIKPDFEKFKSIYRYTLENYELIHLYQGVEEVLKNDEFNCYIYTHRGSSCAALMKKFDIEKYFVEIVDSTYGFRRKPDSEGIDYLVEKYQLKRENTFYIGDRTLDIECGINASVSTIFFNSSKLEIDCSKADFVIEQFKQINDLPF